METRSITSTELAAFIGHLRTVERSAGTIEKYFRDTGRFAAWLEGAEATRERTAAWRDSLLEGGLRSRYRQLHGGGGEPVFHLPGLGGVQGEGPENPAEAVPGRPAGADPGGVPAPAGRRPLALLLETICATGIRVSEVKYITVEAAQAGRAEISLKGKLRTILLPGKLCRKLKKYAKAQKTASGEIFLTRSGKSLSRRQIWAEMKRLCNAAGVAPSKVFPHNLRHLFARTFYKVCRDVVKLADVLGHSSIETTRIYLISTGAEHAEILRKMRLIQ